MYNIILMFWKDKDAFKLSFVPPVVKFRPLKPLD